MCRGAHKRCSKGTCSMADGSFQLLYNLFFYGNVFLVAADWPHLTYIAPLPAYTG